MANLLHQELRPRVGALAPEYRNDSADTALCQDVVETKGRGELDLRWPPRTGSNTISVPFPQKSPGNDLGLDFAGAFDDVKDARMGSRGIRSRTCQLIGDARKIYVGPSPQFIQRRFPPRVGQRRYDHRFDGLRAARRNSRCSGRSLESAEGDGRNLHGSRYCPTVPVRSRRATAKTRLMSFDGVQSIDRVDRDGRRLNAWWAVSSCHFLSQRPLNGKGSERLHTLARSSLAPRSSVGPDIGDNPWREADRRTTRCRSRRNFSNRRRWSDARVWGP